MKLVKRVWMRDFGFFWQTFEYRIDPVPGISCPKASTRSCYRRPKTTQVRRKNCDREIRYLVRGRRRKLSHAWDDIQRSYPFPKCWKNCTRKRKQWM